MYEIFCFYFQNQFHLDIIVLIVVDHHVQNCATIDIKLLELKNKNVETISKEFLLQIEIGSLMILKLFVEVSCAA